jgi:hypothetical protein
MSTLQYGGIKYPIESPGTGGSLLESCDPFVWRALSLYRAVILAYVGQALTDAMAGQVRSAVEQITHLDPSEWLLKTSFAHPLLAVYPVSGTEAGLTLERKSVTTRYRVAYVLPPLTAEQASRVLPVLTAIRKLLSTVTSRQGDESHESHETVFFDAEIASVTPLAWEIGVLKKEDGSQDFPTLFFDLQVVERENYNAENQPDYSYSSASVDLAESGQTTLEDLVIIRDDVG